MGEGKYSPGVDPACTEGSARFSAFYTALVNKSGCGVHRDLCKVARSRVCEQGGLARRKELLRIYSSNRDRSRCL